MRLHIARRGMARPVAWILPCLALVGAGAARGAYTVQRVVGGLNQPTFVTQAPGDNASLYIVERSDPNSELGRIRTYNLQNQSFDPTPFLDLTGQITSDGGVLAMTFHPDYVTNGLFYVTSNINGTNALDEYRRVGGVSQLQRRLLQYQNLNNVFHTINQPLFRPNGNSNELFVTTGDGGTQANEAAFNPALIESPNSIYGKLLRINLTASFPTPAGDATHAGVNVVALGLRNPYRSSFDRQTGDFYIGDVGFNTAEEVNFIPASHFANASAPILDFGWTSREGTIAAVSPHGGPKAPGDIDPIFDYSHGGQQLPHTSVIFGQSITGGYVYRGPVTELQGRYFFADYMNSNVYSGTFNPATPVASYNGTNLTGITNHTVAFENAIGGGADIRSVTSFGEDNAGNLYIVKFGNSLIFPPLGQGEIFRISPVGLAAVVDRDTGAITLTNNTGSPISITSLSISSAFGAIDRSHLTPITGHYDQSGSGLVDNNNNWTITSPAGSYTLFSEASAGDPGTLAAGQQISLSDAGGWIRSPVQDLTLNVQVAGGSVLSAGVSYIGNNGQPFASGDLDFNGTLDRNDWALFVANASANLAGLSGAQAYGRGDLDGDKDNDFADFRQFKRAFNSVNGVGAFEAMIAEIPEPAAWQIAALAVAAAVTSRRRPFQTTRPGVGRSLF
jgi:hypothetical protein